MAGHHYDEDKHYFTTYTFTNHRDFVFCFDVNQEFKGQFASEAHGNFFYECKNLTDTCNLSVIEYKKASVEAWLESSEQLILAL